MNIKQADLVCPQCGRFSVGGITHPVCKSKYGLDGLWSLGIYKAPLKNAIQSLKYKGIKELSDILAYILIEYWAKFNPMFLDQVKTTKGKGWLVVPVPLHWYRENIRGFNQVQLISQSLSQTLGLDYCEALKKVRHTSSQTRLNRFDRRKNIQNAFSLSTNYLVRSTNVLLIDDVWTTGSTLKECCYVLKSAGAKKVWAITLAR